MDTKIQNFLPSQVPHEGQWYLGDGCSPADLLFPDGHGWGPFMPMGEVQSRDGFDSTNCTNYSLLNNIESIGRKKYGIEFQANLSERHRGIESGTTQFGNNFQNVCESLRTTGAIPEAFLPFDNTINSWVKYYSPRPMTFALWKVAESWKRKYSYNHDWVFLSGDSLEVKQAKMKEALKYSPLSVAGYAWAKRDGLYRSVGQANHAFDVYDFVEGKYWIALDSYADSTGSFIKNIAWDYNFTEAKRHSLTKNVGAEFAPEPKYTEYLAYRIKWYLKEIMK